MQKFRYAPPDHTLPKPWRGLVDSATSNLYFWNPETNVTTYVRPIADPQPPHSDLDNHSDRSHQIHGVVDLSGCGDDINNGDPSHQSPGVNRDTSSQLNDQQSVPASEAHEEDHGHKHESTVLAKRKDTSKSCTLKKTFWKKQKTTSPPLVVDGHVEESIMKPTEVSHSVEKEQQEFDEVHKPEQLAKETRKMSEVEGEVPQSANTNGAKLIQANRSETFEMNVISSICTPLVAKEMGNSLPEEMPIMGTDMNQELLSVADGTKGLDEINDVSSICTTLVAKETGKSLPEEMPIVGTDPNQELLSVADGPKDLSSLCTTLVAKETGNSLHEEMPIVGTDLNQEQLSVADGPKGLGEMNGISSICTSLVAKETGNSLAEEMPIMGTDPNQVLLSVADGPKGLGEMNVISTTCTTLVAKETGNSLSEEMSFGGTDLNQEPLSVADESKGLGEDMIDRDGLTGLDGGSIIDNMSNDNVDCPVIDSTQIETNLDKQPINRSLAPPIHKVEEDLALTQSIDRLAGVTDQLSEVVEAMRYMIHYATSAKETDVQRRRENEELKKNVADLEKKVADLEAKLKETMVGNQHARCQFLG